MIQAGKIAHLNRVLRIKLMNQGASVALICMSAEMIVNVMVILQSHDGDAVIVPQSYDCYGDDPGWHDPHWCCGRDPAV